MFDSIGGSGDDDRSPLWAALFDSDWQQRTDIDRLRDRTASMSRRLSDEQASLDARVRALEQRVAELALVNRALLAVLVESGAVDRGRFDDQLLAFDLEDGEADGR